MHRRAISTVVLAFSLVAALGSASSQAWPQAPAPTAIQSAPHVWADAQEAKQWAAGTLAKLSLEQKIGQMICPDIAAGYMTDNDPRLATWITQAKDLGVGMFVLYGGTPRDVARLLNRLQKEAPIPLLISADFEGGPGQQVTGASEFPGNMGLAAAGSDDLMYRLARIGAIEGRAMGIHLTYTPVVDIAVRPDNPAESVRSFGGDMDLLGRMVRAYTRGYRDGGMLTTAKHFPGRGDAVAIPGVADFVQIDKPAAVYEAQEARAFQQAIDAGVSFIMTEHIAVPSITGGSMLPASVEKKLATTWIREKLGFKGILTTDDLWYAHVVKRFGENEVAVLAVEAGHDIVLKPKDPAGAINAIAAAVRSGRIPQSRIDEAVTKLLELKARLSLHKNRFVDESRVNALVGTPEHLAVVQEAADASLTVLKNDGLLPLAPGRLAGGKVVHIAVQKLDGDPSPAALTTRLAAVVPGLTSFTLRPDLDPAYYEQAWPAIEAADLVIVSLFVQRTRQGDPAPMREADLAFLNRVIAAKPKAVLAMSYGNPQAIRRIENVTAFAVGYGERGWYGNQPVYFDSFIKLLKGELTPSGRLPVRVSDTYPIGAGLVGRPVAPSAPAPQAPRSAGTINPGTLLDEMVDFENLARVPSPFYRSAAATSYSRASRAGGEAWFDNMDRGQYVRTATHDGRQEHVMADLRGPGAVTRFWSANPDWTSTVRFYFDGETQPRLALPLKDLFTGTTPPFDPAFSYISGTGGNLYYPLPYQRSLEITIEENEKPAKFYYEIGYRTYDSNAHVETFNPAKAGEWATTQAHVATLLAAPVSSPAPANAEWRTYKLSVMPGTTAPIPDIAGSMAVYEWSARVLGTHEDGGWTEPHRAHNAYRHLLLEVDFDGQPSIRTPLGEFFGSGPGVNPYSNLFFTVAADGTMTSRLLMGFRSSMRLSLTNEGQATYDVELRLRVGARPFGDRDMYLRAQWDTTTRNNWPPFDWNVLTTSGTGKIVGTVYQIANPVLIWWGEGDQKVFIDGETFPSVFGTGTEDDYGYAYGDNRPFTRPYHAQTRVDGPGSGGHISLNRWYVLDALPYRSGLRFEQEMWHWMPARPTWSHVVYWYAAPGTPGPREFDRASLAPVDLGIRANMLDPQEGEALPHTTTGGTAAKERLANCSEAEHLVWRGAKPGDRLTVTFKAPKAGRYSIELNLAQSPDYGRYSFAVNGEAVPGIVDGYSAKLFWLHPKLGTFSLKKGDNVLTIESVEPNPRAMPGSLFGLDYVFLVRD
jgi:beta-glucosidase-like glycosyl hydrolase